MAAECIIDGCAKRRVARGWCANHYGRWQRHGDPCGGRIAPGVSDAYCTVSYCNRKRLAAGLCSGHYHRLLRDGDVQADKPLRQQAPKGQGCIRSDGYRYIWRDGKTVLEHRVVMEQTLGRALEAHETVHHRNGDRLDNRPENLELWVSPTAVRGGHRPGQRAEDLVAYAVSLLERYAPERLDRS